VSPEDRRLELATDVHRIAGFLGVVIGEAAHLHLDVPEDVSISLLSLTSWERQLRTPASESRSSQG
jgi:hypothetical protein